MTLLGRLIRASAAPDPTNDFWYVDPQAGFAYMPGGSNPEAYQGYTLAGWARGLNRGDVLVLYVKPGAVSVQRATLTLECLATVAAGSGQAPGSDKLPAPWGYWPMDEVSQFQVDGAPSAWWYGSIAGGGRFLYFKHTFQLVGDQESLLNGDAFGPIYIPPGKAFSAYWKEASRKIGIGDWAGGAQGAVFYDDAMALQNLRIIGYKIYTNSIDGGSVGIKGWQAIYRATDGSRVYAIAAAAGHSSITMTHRYVHPQKREIWAAFEKKSGHTIGHTARVKNFKVVGNDGNDNG
jgi:hypothetical protein